MPLQQNMRSLHQIIRNLAAQVDIKSAIVELLAMAAFIYISCGTVMTYLAPNGFQYNNQTAKDDPTYLPHTNSNLGIIVPFVFGFTVMVLAYSTRQLNAGHLNPAVTLALTFSNKFNRTQAVLFLIAQILGALIAMAFLIITVPNANDSGFGANKLSEGVSALNACIGETFLTAVLVLVVLYTDDHLNKQIIAPIAIGSAVFFAHGVLLPMDGCSINPTRSFAPAIFSSTWDEFWVFLLGPFLGSMIATGIYQLNTRVNEILRRQQVEEEDLRIKQEEEERQKRLEEKEEEICAEQASEPNGTAYDQPESPNRPSTGEMPKMILPQSSSSMLASSSSNFQSDSFKQEKELLIK